MNACAALVCFLAALAGSDVRGSGSRLTVHIAAPASVIAELTARLTGRLTARGVALDMAPLGDVDFERLVATPPDTAEDAPLAHVWLDGRAPGRALLFVLPRQGQRLLIRKIELAAGFDQVALAEVTYIVDRAVASLLLFEPIGVPQSEARAAVAEVLSASSAPSIPPPEAPPGPRFTLGAFGGVGTWSSDAVAVGRLGIEGVMEVAGDSHRLGLAASAVADPCFHVVQSGGELLARSLALHLFATATWRVGRTGAVGLAVGPALIVTRMAPQLNVSTPAETATAAPRTDLDPALGVTARWELPLGRRGSLFLAALVDVVPLRARYAATIRGQDQVLFSPWAVRPGLVLGFAAATGPR